MASTQLKMLTANQLKKLLTQFGAIACPPTVMIFGDPGIGKSFAISEAAQEMGMEYIPISLGRVEPYDIKGIPDVSGDYTKWKLPWFWKRAIDAGNKGGALIHFDEATLAAEDVQGAVLDVCWQKVIDDVPLPPKTFFVFSGNMGGEDGTFARAFSSALTGGRGFLYGMRPPEVKEWIDYQKPVDLIAKFLKAYENKCFYVPPVKGHPFEPWTNPRGWSQLDMLLKALKLDEVKDATEIISLAKGILSPTTVVLLEGWVGDAIINPTELWAMKDTAWKQYNKNNSNPLKKKAALTDVLDIVCPLNMILTKAEDREKLQKSMETFVDKLVDTEKTIEVVTSFLRQFGSRQAMVFDKCQCKGQKLSAYFDKLMKEEGSKAPSGK